MSGALADPLIIVSSLGDTQVGLTISVDQIEATVQIADDAQAIRNSAPINITDEMVFTIVRAWVLDILSKDLPVVKGQDNRVPEPREDDWIEITPGLRSRLATNSVVYVDPVTSDQVAPFMAGQRVVTQPTQIDVQIDVHGPSSAENVTIIEILFRDDDACTFFQVLNTNIAPLYASEPRQLPFINEGGQFEDRWSIDVSLQANIAISRPQQFAGDVEVTQLTVLSTQ